MEKQLILSLICIILTITSCIQNAGKCSGQFKTVNAENFRKTIESGNIQILDVRTDSEYYDGHLKNALLIDIKEDSFLNAAKTKLDPAKTVAIYCRSGRRSAHAASVLSEEGFNVVNLDGGIIQWQETGGIVEK